MALDPLYIDASRICAHCSTPLQRKRSANGDLERPDNWAKRRFCSTACHYAYQRAQRRNDIPTDDAAFWSHVDKNGPLWNGTPCWLWTGARMKKGYGHLGRQIGDKQKHLYAHRYAYMLAGNAIPDGMTLDHLCRNRICVNPEHLEPVPMAENLRRGAGFGQSLYTHCPNGHLRIPENVIVRQSGSIVCRVCQDAATERYKQRRQTLQQLRPHDECRQCGRFMPIHARGLCNACYQRARRASTP